MISEEKSATFCRNVAKRLEEWYKDHGQRFPWREVKDPYVILITELLLQRTKAKTVEKVYAEIFSRYPTIKDLAAASVKDLNSVFSKLGLFYRSKRLCELAREIVNRYGGKVPCDMEKLLRIKGVGVYIASATLNFGCDKPTPVVDRNVLRVLNRLMGITTEKLAREFIMTLYQYGNHRTLGFALIDLGMLICTKKPKHNVCPLADLCKKHPLIKAEWRMLRKVIKGDEVKLQEQLVYNRRNTHTQRTKGSRKDR